MLVGEDPLIHSIKNEAVEFAIKEIIIFAGTRKDVKKLFQGVDILILASLYENDCL